MRGVGRETFEAIDQLKKINPDAYQSENGADYPKGRFGQSLMEIVELFKADVGLGSRLPGIAVAGITTSTTKA